MHDLEYEAIARRLGYAPDVKELERRGYGITVIDNGRRVTIQRPGMPVTALERAIERELVDEGMLHTREVYIELQRAYNAMQGASCASIYSVRGNDGDGSGASQWVKLMKHVRAARPFNLCDWGFWNPPEPGVGLHEYAEAFEAIRAGLKAVADEMADL